MPLSFWIEALEYLGLMCELAAILAAFHDENRLALQFITGAKLCAAAIVGIGKSLGE